MPPLSPEVVADVEALFARLYAAEKAKEAVKLAPRLSLDEHRTLGRRGFNDTHKGEHFFAAPAYLVKGSLTLLEELTFLRDHHQAFSIAPELLGPAALTRLLNDPHVDLSPQDQFLLTGPEGWGYIERLAEAIFEREHAPRDWFLSHVAPRARLDAGRRMWEELRGKRARTSPLQAAVQTHLEALVFDGFWPNFWREDAFFAPLSEARDLVFEREPLSATRRYLEVLECLMANSHWRETTGKVAGTPPGDELTRLADASDLRAALLMSEALGA